MEISSATIPPSVKTPLTPKTASVFTYTGPDYTEALHRNGVDYRPKSLSDAQIEQFLKDNDWAKAWFKKA